MATNKHTKQMTFSLSHAVYNKLRDLQAVKSINLSKYIDSIIKRVHKINEGEN